jgi:hypothetical protein
MNSDFYRYYAFRCFAVGSSLSASLTLTLSFLVSLTSFEFLRNLGPLGVFLLVPAILAFTFAGADMTVSAGQALLKHPLESVGASAPADFSDEDETTEDS